MNRLQRLAIGLTHYIYRNTKIEDYHADMVNMDNRLYLWALDYYKERIKIVLRRKKIIKALENNDIEAIKEMLEYYGEKSPVYCMIFEIILFMANTTWDAPVEVEKKDPHTTGYRYMLEGKFFRHCMDGDKLDNKVMCDINKDICNRIYTLLLNGYFD